MIISVNKSVHKRLTLKEIHLQSYSPQIANHDNPHVMIKNKHFSFWILLATLSIVSACTFSTGTFSNQAFAVDLEQIEKELTGDGVTGWIHGSVGEESLYVFTYRNPKDFFDAIQMSLISKDSTIEKQLASFGRHDQVKVKGKFLRNPSPQKHIMVTEVTLVKKYESTYPTQPYPHDAKIPEEVVKQNSGVFLIHAIAGEGKILVVEYKDTIFPIFVKNAELAKITKTLYRNDIARLYYKVQREPDQPTHLVLDGAASKPITILDSIQAINGVKGTIEGALILFPKSPEIIFNVFAVEQKLDNELKRQFTIVNFDDAELFKKIREALQKAWDRHEGKYVNGRNKLVSTAVKVKVTGTFNEISPSQANPQILIKAFEDLEIIEK